MTSETKLNHSPAPWVVSDNTATPYGQLTVDSEQSGAVAICYTVERGENAAPRECLANARLISAAPDMLYVLQAIAADIENRARLGLDAPAWYTRARAAIDKATG